MFALVDCNNFYCSCERVFNPALNGRPVIVLSNNDGCAIARSEEAKAIGIVMGSPEYLIRDVIDKHRVAVFSSNYTLYGDMSDRVMQILTSFVPRLEVYSIDESFLDVSEMAYSNLLQLGMNIRKKVAKDTGLPVTVGIAPTKTLAKLANGFAKRKRRDLGVHWIANDHLLEEALHATEIGDVWGIGHQHGNFLRRQGFKTAADFIKAPEEWILKNMAVVGHRLVKELKGTSALECEFEPKKKKNICTSRSFGTLTQSKDLLAEALSNYTALCAEKLRKEKSCARKINIFVQTNPFRTSDRQYAPSITIELDVPTNNTPELIKYALKGLEIIFQPDHLYQKCGIVVCDLVSQDTIQSSFLDGQDRKKGKLIMQIMDKVNRSLGREVVRFAVQGFEKKYKLKAEFLSQRYTTNINEVLHVNN
ncbi:MAG: Y-family DNA polymerase [Chitinophagaceae bacterium]